MNHPIPDAALDDRLGFIGSTGSGKTYGAATAEERVLEMGGRVVHVDPLGVAWGLRLSPDGKEPSGYPVVIFGGPHGDLPLGERHGAVIGETVAGMAESAIIDLSGIGTAAGERRFMLAFLTALYRHNNKRLVHLVLDEADLWAPQRILDKEGDATKLQSIMERIVRRGRVEGFIPWLITQRPAVLSKNVLSQVDGLVAFKLPSSHDRAALGAWIEGQADGAQGKELLGRLPTKQPGEALVWIPGRGILTEVTFPLRQTYDSSRAPKRGEEREAVALKPLDVETLRARLAAIVDADAKPTAKKAAPDPEAIKAAELRGFIRGCDAGVLKAGRRLVDTVGALLVEFGLETADAELRAKVEPAETKLREGGFLTPAHDQKAVVELLTSPEAKKAFSKPDDLTGPQAVLLQSLAWWKVVGINEPTRTQVAAIARWRPNGSNLRNRLSECHTKGLISYPVPGRARLTEAGHAAAPVPDLQTTVVDSIVATLTKPQRLAFVALMNMPDQKTSRQRLAEVCGWEPGGSNLRNRLSELKALELIHYPSPGEVALQDWMFP